MNTAIQNYLPTEEISKSQTALAIQVAKSGLYPSIKMPEQAYVIMQTGFEMGMTPIESLQSLYAVNGNVKIWGTALVKRFGLFGWKIEWGECNDIVANVTVSKNGEIYIEKANKGEVEGGNAYKKAKSEKLRYHALRKIANFSIPEILGPLQNEGIDINEIQRGDKPIKIESVEVDEDFKSVSYVKETNINGHKGLTITEEGAEEVYRRVKTGEWVLSKGGSFTIDGLTLIPELIQEIISPFVETKEPIKEVQAEVNINEMASSIFSDPLEEIKDEWRLLIESGRINKDNEKKVLSALIKKHFNGKSMVEDLTEEESKLFLLKLKEINN